MLNAKSRAACLLILGSVVVSGAAHADDYRGNVDAGFTHIDSDDEFFPDIDILQLSGTWYFAKVETDGVPLAEAAYLGRASRLSAVASQAEFPDVNLGGYAATVGYYIPNTMFRLGAAFARSEGIAFNGTTTRKTHDTHWSGSLGIAPIDGLLLTTEFDEDSYVPNLTIRYVSKLPNSHFYAASLSLVDPNAGDLTYALDVDYFFDLTFKAGVGYADGDDWTIRAEKFFTPRVSVRAQVRDNEFSSTFSVNAAMRF